MASTLITTVSTEAGQVPLVMLHWKIFGPVASPLTEELFAWMEFMLPLPETSVQVPSPFTGRFPAKLEEEEQIVWSGPASAADTKHCTCAAKISLLLLAEMKLESKKNGSDAK